MLSRGVLRCDGGGGGGGGDALQVWQGKMNTPAGNCACCPFQQNCCTHCDSQVSCEMVSCNLLSSSMSCTRFTHVLHQFFLHMSCTIFTHTLHHVYTCPTPCLQMFCIRFIHVLHHVYNILYQIYTCPAPRLQTFCVRFTYILQMARR